MWYRHMVIHYRDLRLANNAGLNFPACYAGSATLDVDKAGLPTSNHISQVNCNRCLRIAEAHSWQRQDAQHETNAYYERGSR